MCPDKLRLGVSRFGRGVFAVAPIQQGEEILEFAGPVLHRESVPRYTGDVPDHYMQIGPEMYLGPSGGLDDFINHACDPNTGVRTVGDRIVLIARRDITSGEELSMDYSTTMDEDDWEMRCGCGSPHCRSCIQDFKNLPEALQQRYISENLVLEYIVTSLGAPRIRAREKAARG